MATREAYKVIGLVALHCRSNQTKWKIDIVVYFIPADKQVKMLQVYLTFLCVCHWCATPVSVAATGV